MAEESLDPNIYGQEYVDLVDKYRNAGGEKFTVQHDATHGYEFKEAMDKMNDFIKKSEASKEKEAVDTGKGTAEFKGDRAQGKKTWEYLSEKGAVTQDLETWLGGVGNDTEQQTKTHNYLRETGAVTQDFNAWREGFTGIAAQEDDKSPTFLVDGKTLDINGVEVSTSGSNTLKTFETEDFLKLNQNIEDEVQVLRKNPILFPEDHEMAGQVDTEATNAAIKEVQNTAPPLLTFNPDDANTSIIREKNRARDVRFAEETEAQRLVRLEVNQQTKDLERIREEIRLQSDFDMDTNKWEQTDVEGSLTSWKDSYDDLKKLAEQGGMKKPENFDSMWNDLNKADSGGKDVNSKNSYNKKRNKFINDMLANVKNKVELVGKGANSEGASPEELKEAEDKFNAYMAGEIELTDSELKGLGIQINPELRALIESKVPDVNDIEDLEELGEAFSTTLNEVVAMDPRFDAIQKDISDNINAQGNEKLLELGDLYDGKTKEGLQLIQKEYAKWWNESYNQQMQDNPQANRIYQQYGLGAEDAYSQINRDFERKDTYAQMVFDYVGFDIDNQEESSKDFNWLEEFAVGTGMVSEAVNKLPTSIKQNWNKIQVASQASELETRAAVVTNIEEGLDSGKLNKEMTLGEARKLDKKLDTRLAWHDPTWLDSDNLGEYLKRKEKRENITEKSIAIDIEEMAKANADMSKFVTFDSGSSIINPFGNNNILGIMEAISGTVDQAPHMLPSLVGGAMVVAGAGASSTGAGAIGGVPLATVGYGLMAAGAMYQAGMSYGNIYMDGIERQMQQKYGKNGFTTGEYIESLKDEAIGNQGAALGGAALVFATEFGSDALFASVGGPILKSLAGNPVTKSMLGNTVGNWLLTSKIPQAIYQAKLNAGKEYLTESFQSYLEQGFTNMAAGIDERGNTIDSPFTQNIDFDAIHAEGMAGYKMGHVFGAGQVMLGSSSYLGTNFDKGTNSDAYITQAMEMLSGQPVNKNSKQWKMQSAYLQQMIDGVRNNKNLTADQKAKTIAEISGAREAALGLGEADPNGDASPTQREDYIASEKERKRLDKIIKEVDNPNLTVREQASRKLIDAQQRSIMEYIRDNRSEKPPPGAAGAAAMIKNVENVRATIQNSETGRLTFKDFTNKESMDNYGSATGQDILFSDQQGTIIQNPTTGEQQILINKDVAAKTGGTNVAGHELGHAVLFETVKNNPEADTRLGQAVDTYLADLNEVNTEQLAASDYKDRLEAYKQDPNALQGQEKMMLLSDAMVKNDIKLDEGAINNVKKFINRTLQSVGLQKIAFNKPTDVVAFIENLNRSIEKNKLTPAQETMMASGAEGNIFTDIVDQVDTPESTARVLATEQQASRAVNDSFEQTNRLLADEDFDVNNSLDQKRAVQLAGGVIEAATKRLWRQGSLLTRDQFKTALESEYIKALTEYDAELDTGTGAGSSISTKFNLRANKVASDNITKKNTVSTDSEKAQQVADTTEQKDFDEVETKESTQREKVYASQTDQVDSLDTAETKAIIKDEVSKDILLAAGKGKNAADTARDIANQSKETYFKRLRKDIGTFSSQKYKDFVNSLDKKFIKSLPVAAIKRRFGKLFGIKKIGTTPTKQVSKAGKRSNFAKAVYSIPKITTEAIQAFKDYFLDGEKRQQSLYNMLTTDFALESMFELMNDSDFMNKLQTALGNDGITALEFMESIENKLDQRTKEDTSLDVVQQASRSKLQDLTKPKEILAPGQEIVDGTLRLVNKPKKQLSKKAILDAFNEKGAEGINTLIDALDPNFRKLNAKDKVAAQKVMLESLIKNGMPIKTLLKAANLSPGYSYDQLVNRGLQWISDKVVLEQKVKDRPQTSIPQTLEAYLRGEIGDIKAFTLEMQKKYAQTTDSDITAALQGRAIGVKGIKSRAEADVANYEAIIRGREKILNIVRKLGPSDKAAFIDFLYSNSNLNQNLGRVLSPVFGFQKLYNPLKYAINKSGKKYVTNPIINEHVLQFNEQVKMIASLLDAPSKIYKDGLKYLNKNQFQVPIQGVAQEQTYTTIDGGKWPAKSKLIKPISDAWKSFLNGEIEWTQIPDGIIRYFNEYFYLNPNNVSFRNPINNKIETTAKIYNAEIKRSIKVNGKTFTAKQLMSMNPEGKAMFPNVEKLQARAVTLAASKILSPSEVQQFINANLPAAVAMTEANFIIQENIPGLFQKICNSPCRVPKTSNQIKKTLENSLNTQVNAQKINKDTKGISVFDFDDTLATTNSQVIVNMPDGTNSKIDASEFAAQSVNLENAGAKFDFSEFNEVVGGKKGPLADLALKRQNKFGSGDIFVLTARPQASAQGIKTFLDGIGLNLPIENITGLENGSPQAKAEWILDKTAQGYNDFYFADDAIKNVKAVRQILDQVDVKSRVQQAIVNKSERLNTEFNQQIQDVTGKEAFKTYSKSRASLEGAKQDKGLLNWLGNQLTLTASAEDFMGLMYDLIGKGKEGSRHKAWILDNIINPYNRAEKALLSAKVTVANDFAALQAKFPSLKRKKLSFSNPLLDSIGVGPYSKSQAMRVYMWNKQGMNIPGLSKRDQSALVAAVEADVDLKSFADQVILIQKDQQYPAPGNNWVAGNISSDIMSSLDKGFRRKLMTEFDQNIEVIFSPENMNKLEALYGAKWVEALKDSLRRMKAGSNRPVYQGGGARVVNNLLDWLNGSVGAIMFLNMRSGLLQLTSAVNFINWGDNNMYLAAKAFANQKQYWKDVIMLMNSDYLVNRRDGLKINVNEAELVDAAKKGGMKGVLAKFLDKGFIITRIMDTLAIATGGASFFRNRVDALLQRQNPDTGKTYTKAEAEAKAFDDFYAIAEESQQSSNPSKISQQQASLAGRVILSFQNTTMQYMRMNKKAIRDLYNRRKNPGQTQRESDLGNVSKILYYTTIQNVIFHSLQQALFAGLFEEEGEEDEDKNKTASVANGMLDSLLFGLGFGGAAISTVKNVVLELAKQGEKKAPKYEEAVWSVFDFSPVLDSKVRKLKSGFKSLSWNMDEMKRRGWSLDNPAYLAISQIIAAGTNAPLDRVLRKIMNIRAALDEETRTWQKVALMMGWDTWSVNLPYWGLQSTIRKEEAEDAKIKSDFKADIRKLKADGYKKTMTPEKFDDVIEMKSPYGTVMYYYKLKK